MSLEMLGAAEGDAVLVRLLDPLAIAAAQGGYKGAAAAALAPKTVTGAVLSRLAEELQGKLAGQGIAAQVTVVAAGGMPAAGGSKDLIVGAGIGAAGLAALYGGWRLIRWLF